GHGHGALGIGHWALGIGHLGIGHWSLIILSPLLPLLPHLFTTIGTDAFVRNCLVCSIIWSMSSWDKRWT
ncbi:hypothetical protein FM036_27970, partial [Nostoc sp. HG1]|nr:hypothetical protein [Nostoc sp. HG1]